MLQWPFMFHFGRGGIECAISLLRLYERYPVFVFLAKYVSRTLRSFLVRGSTVAGAVAACSGRWCLATDGRAHHLRQDPFDKSAHARHTGAYYCEIELGRAPIAD